MASRRLGAGVRARHPAVRHKLTRSRSMLGVWVVEVSGMECVGSGQVGGGRDWGCNGLAGVGVGWNGVGVEWSWVGWGRVGKGCFKGFG